MTEIDIPTNHRQSVRRGELTMIGDGPWKIRFNLSEQGDIQANKETTDESLGRITRRINRADQNEFEIEIQRDIIPLLGDFDARKAAIRDLHNQINFWSNYEREERAWDRDEAKALQDAKIYLTRNRVKFSKLNPSEIKRLSLRMKTYENLREEIERYAMDMLKRLKWKRVSTDFKPRSSAWDMAEDCIEYRSLEMTKARLLAEAREANTDWSTLTKDYFNRLGVEMPRDARKREKQVLEKIDAIQIGMNGRIGNSSFNKNRFGSALKPSEKDAIHDKITFKWIFSMWALAHPSDPNSWIKGAAPVPVNFGNPNGVNVLLYGSLNSLENDAVDWWRVQGIDTQNLDLAINAQPRGAAELVGPLRANTDESGPSTSLIRVIAKGNNPIKYRIVIRSKIRNKATLAAEIYEPIPNLFTGSSF